MLLKSADSQEEHVAKLEELIATAPGNKKSKLERDLKIARAGIKGEADAAYLINFDYEKSPNWVIIHDLRLEIGGRTAQIDHLLINRFLDVFVLETKGFHSGLKITEDGEFLRWNNFAKTFEGMASPLAQNERHIAVLKDAFNDIKMPSKLGITLTPKFHSLVLVSPNARVDRPNTFDTRKVIKADALKATIDKQIDSINVLGALAKLIDSGTLYAIGNRLLKLHTARHPKPELAEPLTQVIPPANAAPKQDPSPSDSAVPLRDYSLNAEAIFQVTSAPATPPRCKKCSESAGNILHGQYGYYFKCSACSTNTSMKWDCGSNGHAPRIRKEGRAFFRECQGCGISTSFHQNPEA
jgi:hypothetical protein